MDSTPSTKRTRLWLQAHMAWLGGAMGIAALGAVGMFHHADDDHDDTYLIAVIAAIACLVPALPALLLFATASFRRRGGYPEPLRHPYFSALVLGLFNTAILLLALMFTGGWLGCGIIFAPFSYLLLPTAIYFVALCSRAPAGSGTIERLCPTCRYDLRAHKAGDRCPECGIAIPQGLGEQA